MDIRNSLAFTVDPAMITNTMLVKSINYFFLQPKSIIIRSAVILGLNLVLFSQTAFSQSFGSLRVLDCQGNTRAVKEIPSTEPTEIKVELNSTEIKDVKLVNRNGEIIQGDISGSTATFSNVPTDVWVLSTDSTGGFFSQITFNSVPAGFWVDAGNIALVTAGVVGAVVIGGAIEGSSSSADDSDAGSGGGACVTCNPDQGAPSISPFSSR